MARFLAALSDLEFVTAPIVSLPDINPPVHPCFRELVSTWTIAGINTPSLHAQDARIADVGLLCQQAYMPDPVCCEIKRRQPTERAHPAHVYMKSNSRSETPTWRQLVVCFKLEYYVKLFFFFFLILALVFWWWL